MTATFFPFGFSSENIKSAKLLPRRTFASSLHLCYLYFFFSLKDGQTDEKREREVCVWAKDLLQWPPLALVVMRYERLSQKGSEQKMLFHNRATKNLPRKGYQKVYGLNDKRGKGDKLIRKYTNGLKIRNDCKVIP